MGPDELGLVKEAFATNWIAPLGPHVDAFEREFAELVGGRRAEDGGRVTEDGRLTTDDGQGYSVTRPPSDISHLSSAPLHAAALSSGTAALHLALRRLNLGPGDEVLCSTLTFSASANPILYERATPVFVDSERVSWNMDPARLAEAVADRIRRGRKPRAVIVVHLYGQCADLDPIAAICAEHDIPLIEDAAEALGAIYYGRRTADDGRQITDGGGLRADVGRLTSGIAPGTVGMCGVFSFNGNKIITTSGGGMLVSADAALVAKARFLATQARDAAPHYQHSEVGFNYRLSNVLAGIGRGQLRVLADRVNARRANTAFYQKALGDLPGLAFMPEAPWGRCTRWLTCITIDPTAAGTDREKVRLALAEEAIEARPVWKPMHLQPVFAGAPVYGGAVAEDLFDRGLCLPSGSNLTATDLERVVAVVRHCWGR
ncbi:MAG: DegT/DnrJ/EryC1/StrS family aminotransferase [Opitutaceae bacterium]|nr:DegT/DnrJ/EryC1/StrS family aminotransferase [Opitutaceae bacterium]